MKYLEQADVVMGKPLSRDVVLAITKIRYCRFCGKKLSQYNRNSSCFGCFYKLIEEAEDFEIAYAVGVFARSPVRVVVVVVVAFLVEIKKCIQL